MVYGYYIKDTVGNQRFFTEGCTYCSMSTGGMHEANCPMKDVKIAEIRANSFIKYEEAWKELADK